jgi:single-stranded DNA-binding protein
MLNERTDNPCQVINLIGRLTAKPQLRSSDNGSVVRLRVAVGRRYGNDSDDGEDGDAHCVDVTAFGPQARDCAQSLTKGRRLGIVDRPHHSDRGAEDGRHQGPEVTADHLDFRNAPRKTTQATADAAA